MAKVTASKNVTILERKEIKRNGVILYTLLSSNGKDKYFATVENGKVTAHDCPGYINHGHCYHVDYIHQAEAIAQYDMIGESLKVANQAIIDAKIGTFYEDVVTRQAQEPEVLISLVCNHRVKSDIYNHCGCQA